MQKYGRRQAQQTRNRHGQLRGGDAAVKRLILALAKRFIMQWHKLSGRLSNPRDLQWALVFHSDAIDGGQFIHHASSAMLHVRLHLQNCMWPQCVRTACKHGCAINDVTHLQDLFGPDWLDVQAMVPACIERNMHRLKVDSMRSKAPEFTELPSSCQVAILGAMHQSIVKTSQTSETVRFADGFDGLELLGECNYWPKAESPSPALEVVQGCEQEESEDAGGYGATPSTAGKSASTSLRTKHTSGECTNTLNLHANYNPCVMVSSLFGTGRFDYRGDPPVPRNGLNELCKGHRPCIFDCMRKQSVNYEDVLRKVRAKLCPKAVAFLQHMQTISAPALPKEDGPLHRDLVVIGLQNPIEEPEPEAASGMTYVPIGHNLHSYLACVL